MTDVSSEPIVSIEGVSKEYRRDAFVIPVLSGINLQLMAGDYVSLMGPSGSGKSTLLNLIAGLDKPTSGQFTLAGKILATALKVSWRSGVHGNIGFIFRFTT